jgi:GDP-D-mannose dehydratase
LEDLDAHKKIQKFSISPHERLRNVIPTIKTLGVGFVAIGRSRTVREFIQKIFKVVDSDYQDYVQLDAKYFHLSEVDSLIGDSSKAKEKLGWDPHSLSLDDLIKLMVDHDLNLLSKS